MRFLCGFLIIGMNVFAASPVIFGARGGASFSDDANTVASVAGGNGFGKAYSIGPTVGVRLPLGFSVEGDALYNRQNLNLVQLGGFSAAAHSDSWEFPVMLKYTIGHGMIAPVVGAGFAARHINDFGSLPSYLLTGSTSANSLGFVAGGGFSFRAGPASITPEVRYTRWQSNSLAQSILDSFVPGRNAVQVLIGVTF
jgi:hypothetical protein